MPDVSTTGSIAGASCSGLLQGLLRGAQPSHQRTGDDLLPRRRPLRAATEDEADGPMEHRREPVLEADEIHDVDAEPHEPREEAGDPDSLPTLQTAWNREIVAMLPLSKYLKGSAGGSPRSRRTIWPAAYLPPCMATWATPGRLFSAIMSPTTKISGCPGRVRSSFTLHATGPIDLAAALLGELLAER